MATNKRRGSVLHRFLIPFWNAEDRRPRALWRVLVTIVAVVAVASAVGSVLTDAFDGQPYLATLAVQFVYAGATGVVLVTSARYLDRRPLSAYGFQVDRAWGREVAVGALVGLFVWGGALATSLLAGWATVETVLSPGTVGYPLALGLAIGVAQYVLVGVWEEIVFRGLVLRNAVEGLGWLTRRGALAGGLLASSLVFGVLHADQSGSVLALGFWVLAGLVMGTAYLWTDSLALPIGLHAAFDVSVNHVYGLFAVRASELPFQPPTLVRPAFTGPAAFVELAGPVNTAWVLVAGLSVLVYARFRNGSWRPAFESEYL